VGGEVLTPLIAEFLPATLMEYFSYRLMRKHREGDVKMFRSRRIVRRATIVLIRPVQPVIREADYKHHVSAKSSLIEALASFNFFLLPIEFF